MSSHENLLFMWVPDTTVHA